ncbi:class I SAM-dependent methyltransferase [Undibacterium sp.]|uniref:class I SAM-dependent methyltransferase n=1 Tax=Undibacterium sp. TaxID=1914977 RepID=UPI00374CA8A0
MTIQDASSESVATFNKLADVYASKYFSLTQYDRFYSMLVERLPQTACTVIDIACGPGNVAAYLARVRPDLAITGIDLAPNMITEAKRRVPNASFHVGDCRELEQFGTGFQAAVFAFGLSYLPQKDAQRFFASLSHVLADDGVLLLATITGKEEISRYETASTGDRVFMVYRTPEQVLQLVQACGFLVEFSELLPSPANASIETTDLVLIARKTSVTA